MILNYFKASIRVLRRSALTSSINIIGLALAITCCLFIYIYSIDEFKYDRYHEHADKIYRVTRNFISKEGNVTLHLAHLAPAIAPLIKNDFPDIVDYCRLYNYSNVLVLKQNGEVQKSFEEKEMYMAEPSFLKMFSIDFILGNPEGALSGPLKIVLSDKAANRYFGDESPLGKTLRLANTYDVEVTGVFKSFPQQSHFHPDVLISFSTMEDEAIYGRNELETNWGNNAFSTYILVNDQFDKDRVENQFPSFIDKHFGNFVRERTTVPENWVASKTTTLFLQKLTDIHLHSQLDSELETNGDIHAVRTLIIIACIILTIACFNFINLSTAQATRRLKEVGMRKTLGAVPTDLVVQMLCESILIVVSSFGIAMVTMCLLLSPFNAFTQKELSVTDFLTLEFFTSAALFILGLGIVAGIYPAVVISKWKPALALKGYQSTSSGAMPVRKILVIVQFASAVALTISSLVIVSQLRFLQQASLGYNKDHVVILNLEPVKDTYEVFLNDLKSSSNVMHMTRSSRYPTNKLLDYLGASVQKGDSLVPTQQPLKLLAVDYEFFDTYQIPLADGRNFDKSIITDDSLAFIINEIAVKMLGWETSREAIGKELVYANVRGRVIGVCKDFHFESLHERITPMIFYIKPMYYNYISVRIANNKLASGLSDLEQHWKKYAPEYPFEYEFLDGQYSKLYDTETRQGQLMTIATVLSIAVACLGLFGLTTFNVLQRVKEIGIRKVLGAPIASIIILLFSEILVLVLLANAFAIPFAWYLMDRWLDNFAYRVSVNPVIPVMAIGLSIAITFLTVSYRALKAARANPLQSIRSTG